MRSNTFTTWLAQLLGGLAVVGGGLEVAWIFRGGLLTLQLAGLMVAVLGVVIVIRTEAHERPLRRLRKARRTLDLPSSWTVEFGKALPAGGTIPIVATRTDGTRFIIDVRGYKEVNSAKEVTGKDRGLLVGQNGKYLKPDPIPALSKAATSVGGMAVLWLPQANMNRNLRLPASNLIVVMGNARQLKHALLGAEVGPTRQDLPQVLLERRKKARTPVPAPERTLVHSEATSS